MPKQETELKELEASENTLQAAQEVAVVDSAAPEAETVPAAGPVAVEETVSRAEFDQLKLERDQLVDRIARLQAEFENARKRAEREKVEFRDYATGNVELALKSTGSAEQLRSGVELIVKQMEEVLRQMQVTPVPAVGEEFDPRHHEALGSIERDDLPDHFVADEVRRGYKLRDRLLRPALVRIVSNPKQKIE